LINDKKRQERICTLGHSAITRHARHTPEDEALDVSHRALGDGARVAGGDHQEQKSRQGIHVVVSIRERALVTWSFILMHLQYVVEFLSRPVLSLHKRTLVNTSRRKIFYRRH